MRVQSGWDKEIRTSEKSQVTICFFRNTGINPTTFAGSWHAVIVFLNNYNNNIFYKILDRRRKRDSTAPEESDR